MKPPLVAPRPWLLELLQTRRVLVSLGSGGVGKTSVSATLALLGALAGWRCLVLTIDPARRLANALGLSRLSAEEQRVDLNELSLLPQTPGGTLHAMMLDAARSLDGLLGKHAPSPEVRERVLGHRLYRHMADSLAGAHDLAALEQLYELFESQRYDLIVLDTPPKEHAFDFLDAPSRLVGLLAHARLKWLLRPMAEESRGGGLASLPARIIVRTLSRFTGRDVLRDVASFTLALMELGEGLRDRSHKVEELLAGPDCGFLVVTRPDEFTVSEALEQRHKLRKKGLPFGGFLVNRCHTLPPNAPVGRSAAELQELLAGLGGGGSTPESSRALLGRLLDALRVLEGLRQAEARTIQRLEQALRGEGGAARVLRIREMPVEVHSLRHLERFAAQLSGEG